MFSKAINLLAHQLDLLSFIRTLISRVWASLMAQMVKESACKAGDMGLIPELGRSPGEVNGNPLQYSCLENSMERGVQWDTVHGVAELDAAEQLSLSLAKEADKCHQLLWAMERVMQ